jgi:hypothetical protein
MAALSKGQKLFVQKFRQRRRGFLFEDASIPTGELSPHLAFDRARRLLVRRPRGAVD